jgi:YHS domain-containing protein
MNDLTELARRIAEKLAAQQELAVLHYNHQHERMREWEERHQRYTALADHIVADIIRPRLQELACKFDNAELLCGDRLGRHQCICAFKHTPRYPATAKLELAITRDGSAENVCLLYNLSILPVFFAFKGQDQMTMPLDRLNESKIAEWFDEKIMDFLDAYLQLGTVDQYQTQNEVTDPVCGMRINKIFAAAAADYQGRTYFFCVPECKAKFVVDPDPYLGVVR